LIEADFLAYFEVGRDFARVISPDHVADISDGAAYMAYLGDRQGRIKKALAHADEVESVPLLGALRDLDGKLDALTPEVRAALSAAGDLAKLFATATDPSTYPNPHAPYVGERRAPEMPRPDSLIGWKAILPLLAEVTGTVIPVKRAQKLLDPILRRTANGSGVWANPEDFEQFRSSAEGKQQQPSSAALKTTPSKRNR
jgi:hypothetical protein